MEIGIGLILELPRHEPAVRLGELDGLVDHADGALGGGGYDHPRAEKPHELSPFDAKWLRHGDDQRISLGGAHHGKTNSCVSAGCLDHRLSRLELSRFFGCLDYSQGQSVLHGAKRVEGFNFYEEIYALWRQPVDPDYRCIAHRLENTLIFPPHIDSPDIRLLQREKYSTPGSPRPPSKVADFRFSGKRCGGG